jgi:hypothetical protein
VTHRQHTFQRQQYRLGIPAVSRFARY